MKSDPIIKIFLAIIFWALPAQAQQVGCFVDFANPSVCSTNIWQCDISSRQSNYAYFGYTMGATCDVYIQALSAAIYYQDVAKRNQVLAKKLKKACGVRCRRLK